MRIYPPTTCRFGFDKKNPPLLSEYEIRLTPSSFQEGSSFTLNDTVLDQIEVALKREPMPEKNNPTKQSSRLFSFFARLRIPTFQTGGIQRYHGFVTIPNLSDFHQNSQDWQRFAYRLYGELESRLRPHYFPNTTTQAPLSPLVSLLATTTKQHAKQAIGKHNLHRDGNDKDPGPFLVLLYYPMRGLHPGAAQVLLADTKTYCDNTNHPTIQSFDLQEAIHNREISRIEHQQILNQFTHSLSWDLSKPMLLVLANRAEEGIFHAGMPLKSKPLFSQKSRLLYRLFASQQNDQHQQPLESDNTLTQEWFIRDLPP